MPIVPPRPPQPPPAVAQIFVRNSRGSPSSSGMTSKICAIIWRVSQVARRSGAGSISSSGQHLAWRRTLVDSNKDISTSSQQERTLGKLKQWPPGQHARATRTRVEELRGGSGGTWRSFSLGLATGVLIALIGVGVWSGYYQPPPPSRTPSTQATTTPQLSTTVDTSTTTIVDGQSNPTLTPADPSRPVPTSSEPIKPILTKTIPIKGHSPEFTGASQPGDAPNARIVLVPTKPDPEFNPPPGGPSGE